MRNHRVTLTVAALVIALGIGCKREQSSSTETTSAPQERSTAAGEQPAAPPYVMPSLSSDDRDFMTKAAQGAMLEVALGKQASQKGASPAVKSFGDRMVADHTNAANELQQLATKKGVALPSAMDSSHQSDLDKLSKLNGAKLDKEYTDDMVDDHEEDVKEFRKAAQEVKDPDLRAWAAKMIPTLENHLSMARDLKAQVKH